MNSNTSHLNSIEALKLEQLKVRQRLTQHEKEFKKKFQQLPGELAVASANNFIPRFLRGKVTNTALNGGKFLIDKFFVSEDDTNKTNIITKANKSGIIPFVKTVFRMFKARR
jgi:hypothetical protein